MFINNFDPVAFQVFSIEIRWYSLAYIFGLIFGWIYCKRIFIKDNNIQSKFDDYIAYLIFGILIGGRFGYVLIYNPIYYLNNIYEIPMIWKGGMSFHGAVVGIILSTIIFCRKNNQNIFYYLDLIALTSPIGIFLGRLANFLNSELYGRQTDVSWSVKFIKVDELKRHPSQIYEALFEGLILFLILNFVYKKFRFKDGLISCLFLILYSIFRYFVEFTREPDSHLGFIFMNMTMGQIISIFSLLIGIFLFYLSYDFKK